MRILNGFYYAHYKRQCLNSQFVVKWQIIPHELGRSKRVSIITINISSKSFQQRIKTRYPNKRDRCSQRVTLSIFATDVIACLEYPIKTTEKLLQIRTFNKVTANTEQNNQNHFYGANVNGVKVLFYKSNIKKSVQQENYQTYVRKCLYYRTLKKKKFCPKVD